MLLGGSVYLTQCPQWGDLLSPALRVASASDRIEAQLRLPAGICIHHQYPANACSRLCPAATEDRGRVRRDEATHSKHQQPGTSALVCAIRVAGQPHLPQYWSRLFLSSMPAAFELKSFFVDLLSFQMYSEDGASAQT